MRLRRSTRQDHEMGGDRERSQQDGGRWDDSDLIQQSRKNRSVSEKAAGHWCL
jgi:hypothetical protein